MRQACPFNPAGHTVRIAGAGQTVSGIDFGIQISRVPHLSVSVSSDRRRRCATGITTISITYRY
jgi:hypothetical protein